MKSVSNKLSEITEKDSNIITETPNLEAIEEEVRKKTQVMKLQRAEEKNKQLSTTLVVVDSSKKESEEQKEKESSKKMQDIWNDTDLDEIANAMVKSVYSKPSYPKEADVKKW